MSQQDVGSVMSYILSAAGETLRLDIKEMVNGAIPVSKDGIPELMNDSVTFINEVCSVFLKIYHDLPSLLCWLPANKEWLTAGTLRHW
jgi:hypothetical protein